MDASSSELAVETKLKLELKNLGSLSPSHCIIRVPEMFCNANEEAYTPRTISIGPYHSKTSNLKGMHHHKIRYLQYFLQRTEIRLRTFVELAKEWEAQVRECYDEDMKLNSNELVMMIVIDGIFLVEFLLRGWEKQENLLRVPGSKDVPFKKTEEDELFRWTYASDIIRDLFLLENQLPLFIFQRLYRRYRADNEWISILFSFCLHYLDPSSHLGASNISSGFELDTQNKMHLVDFLHSICTPKYWENSTEIIVKKVYRRHVALTRSATELHEAGVEFGPRVGNGTLPFQVNFDDKLGELQIAPLTVNMQTESMFRNVIAHEHLHRKDKVICSYVVFMYYLTKTRHDVDLLIKSKVLVNYLGDSEEICTLFTNLFKIALRDYPHDFSYSRICLGLNNYSRNWWYRQRARWFKWTAREYFGAALVLLALTLIQTVCAIKSTNWNWNRRVPRRAGMCTTPVHVTSSQLIASEIFPIAVVKALLYPGAVANGLISNMTVPSWDNVLNTYNLTDVKGAPAVTDLQRLEVLAGSYFSVAGGLLGILKPGRMSMFGTLLIVWGLVKEGFLGKPVNIDPARAVYVYPTMLIALVLAFSSVKYDVKKVARSAPTRPIAKPLQSSSKSKLN